ncbi:MAG: LL-diaminopimelate aminotransferase [Gemmatimonadetes bacterium]|nr:LL-diaminopimelate aminotransferase [Gemmatimonadota bacterium]|tara:strand:+ start:111 stop:1334 length:1224 start_codon:yes stop_codon:yes gene_type:complete
MARINANYNKLAAGYLFPEIARRTAEFVNANDGVEVMRLGIGDTTEPLTQAVLEGLHGSVDELSSPDTYSGYGDGEGKESLRKALADRYGERGAQLDETEVFISDGAKSDSANIQSLFSNDAVICVQDPAYPVYVDTNVIGGRTGDAVDGQYEGLVYLPCTEANGFVPEPPSEHVDLIYLCNPNNPTGAVATKSQLEAFVTYAREHKAVIFFDAAYSAYITDPELPKSIYELEGAETCAIELNSFSKDNGFTGLRLGWAVVPQALVAEDAEQGKLNTMWRRRQNTFFNGPANIVQDGALASLTPEGRRQSDEMVAYYKVNAKTIRDCLESIGLTVYGGSNAPYLWMKTPDGIDSWSFFDKLLSETHVVGTPGSGFGPSGEGFFRLSAFGHEEDIARAVQSIRDNLKL